MTADTNVPVTTRRTEEAPYFLDSGTDLGREQLECLEVMLDDHSKAALRATGIRRGQRCLEVGAGSGSIARWMADQVQPDGRVVAVDIETSRLTGGPALDVRRHDINDGAPEGGPFDLIHARLVLMHLKRRREIVADLVDALAPGGWLVLGEFLGPVLDPVTAPGRSDAEVFHRVVEATIDRTGGLGVSYEWAHEVDDVLDRAGLTDVHAERQMETVSGGGTGCILYRNYMLQAAPLLAQAGVSAEEMDRFSALMLDPRFRTWFFERTYVRGQKPW